MIDPEIQAWAEHLHRGAKHNAHMTGITVDDFITWLDGSGDGDPEKVHDAVVASMGTQTVEYYESVARLPYALEYHLGCPAYAGLDMETHIGGIDITRSFD